MNKEKALAAMRRYRQRAMDSEAAARAIRRLIKTATWRAIVREREANQSAARGHRYEGMGY